jgi:hypothetical protein
MSKEKYHITLKADGLPAQEGRKGAKLITEEFRKRPHHQNAHCYWDDKENSLLLQAVNDFDSDGRALLDEFSDCISACFSDVGNGDLKILSIVNLKDQERLELDSVGEIIAVRQLALNGKYAVTVTIGKSVQYPTGNPDYYCPFQITGIGRENIRYTSGVDAIQALHGALQVIGTYLYTSSEYKSGSLRWFVGDESRNLGFPVTENVRDLLPEE